MSPQLTLTQLINVNCGETGLADQMRNWREAGLGLTARLGPTTHGPSVNQITVLVLASISWLTLSLTQIVILLTTIRGIEASLVSGVSAVGAGPVSA
eukprot:2114787-Pyramimonas_sp.AAC.1